MYKRSRATCLLFSSEDGVTREVIAGVCSNRRRWCFIGETEEKKKEVGKWLLLLKRTTKWSNGGLLTELPLEKGIFKEYLRMIQSISVLSEPSEILSIQYFCIHQRYCIPQRYRVSQPAIVIQSISVWRDEGTHSILVHSIAATPNDLPPWLLVLLWGSSTAWGDIRTRQIHAFFSGAASVCTLRKLVACCGREMHSLLEPNKSANDAANHSPCTRFEWITLRHKCSYMFLHWLLYK